MSDIVIKAENLGKMYTIGHQGENGRYVALRDVLMQNARTLWNKTKDLAKGKPIIQGDTLEEVWALKDVSFEIHRGEAVGIIGRNGAGKSTLLKVLSRITEPSAGRVTIKGRVASLLEVGTGFHPELSGRENIYLNGTILGMTRAEIKQKFDEIVAFAEVEKYLDTPVKRYSSGMYVRLAFAVAAHLEPDILIVDEVLAVGDALFQKKCLGKMEDVAKEGRTVLFVSHNMAAVKDLCVTSILLNNGNISHIGTANDIVREYLSEPTRISAPTDFLNDSKNRRGNGEVRFTEIKINNTDMPIDPTLEIKIIFSATIVKTVDNVYFYLGVMDPVNRTFVTGTRYVCLFDEMLNAGSNFTFEFTIPPDTFRTGIFPLYFWLGKNIELCDYSYDVVDSVYLLNLDTDKRKEELGYNSAQPYGLFNLKYKINNLSLIK